MHALNRFNAIGPMPPRDYVRLACGLLAFAAALGHRHIDPQTELAQPPVPPFATLAATREYLSLCRTRQDDIAAKSDPVAYLLQFQHVLAEAATHCLPAALAHMQRRPH